MAIMDYEGLSAAIDTYTDRSYAAALKDIWIGNAEAKFNRRLTSSFRRMMDTTLTTDSTGLASLPSGFAGLRSVIQDATGKQPLKQASWDGLLLLNPNGTSSDPTHYAIKGTSLRVTPVYEGNLIAVFDSTVTGLSDTNTTNWLLSLAPDCYLTMCLAEEALYTREFTTAAGLEGSANGMLDDIVSMDQVAQFGNAEMVLDMVTP